MAKMMKSLLATLSMALLLGGCVAPAPTVQPRRAAFVESEYLPYRSKGTGRIVGQVFMKTRSGDVKLGAGSAVYLNPVTAHSTEWFEAMMSPMAVLLAPPDARAIEFSRTTMADAGGNFDFTDLPAGEYYVLSSVFWEYVSGPSALKTGGRVGLKVKVQSDQTAKALLTR